MMTLTTSSRRSYEKLKMIESFEERLEYLMLFGSVGDLTFNGNRYVNQQLYRSSKWKRVRREVILRDNGCDLGHPDYEIQDYIYIHHLNPITLEDIINLNPCVFDLNNLVCTSFKTHGFIHYGTRIDRSIKVQKVSLERYEGDTTLW